MDRRTYVIRPWKYEDAERTNIEPCSPNDPDLVSYGLYHIDDEGHEQHLYDGDLEVLLGYAKHRGMTVSDVPGKAKKKVQHTPTPWYAVMLDDKIGWIMDRPGNRPGGRYLLELVHEDDEGELEPDPEVRYANLRFVEQACNSYEELVCALDRILGSEDTEEAHSIAREALKKAKRGS